MHCSSGCADSTGWKWKGFLIQFTDTFYAVNECDVKVHNTVCLPAHHRHACDGSQNVASSQAHGEFTWLLCRCWPDTQRLALCFVLFFKHDWTSDRKLSSGKELPPEDTVSAREVFPAMLIPSHAHSFLCLSLGMDYMVHFFISKRFP